MATLISEENIREEITDFISDFDDEIVPKRELSSTYILSTFLLTFFQFIYFSVRDLCLVFNKTEQEMVSALMAYIISNNITHRLTLDLIDYFERKELTKMAQNEMKANSKAEKKAERRASRTPFSYDSKSVEVKCQFINEYNDSIIQETKTTKVITAFFF